MEIKTRLIKEKNTAVIKIIGEVDLYNSSDVRNEFSKQTDAKIKNIILDLGELMYIDSSGIASLIFGLRRIESSLIQGGYKREDVFIEHPDMLHKSIGPDTKVVGINVMDPLGMAPVTTTMSPEKLS